MMMPGSSPCRRDGAKNDSNRKQNFHLAGHFSHLQIELRLTARNGTTAAANKGRDRTFIVKLN
jgi:hypothetical protein